MDTQEIYRRVIGDIAKVLQMRDRDITPDNLLSRELGASSLDLLEIVIDIEDDFGIEILDNEWKPLRTVRDWIALVVIKTGSYITIPA